MVFTPGVTPGGRSCSTMIPQNTEAREVGQEIDTESFNSQDLLVEGSGLSAKSFANFTQKRIRKPTLRYTNESLNLNSRYFRKGQKFSTSSSMDKFAAVKHLKHPHVISSTPIFSSDESFIEAIQVPFGSESEEECPMKNEIIAVCVTEMDSSPDQLKHKSVRKVISDNDDGQRRYHKFTLSEVCDTEMEQSPHQPKHDSVTTAISEHDGGQKKQHKLWTLSEVWTLIEGVSQYGVGRWSEIRKLFFSSTHRTSVDLKDKWRNLLKASCSEGKCKKEEDRRQKPRRPLPESVLQRVSELARIYPYPRFGKSKLSETKISNARHSPTILPQGQATF